VRYYPVGETIFIDVGSAEMARNISGHVVAFESGTSDADRQHEIWSICAIGVVARPGDAPDGETILEMRPDLLSGWVESWLGAVGDSPA
jgi:hypothetical protein